MSVHELKTWPPYFRAVEDGSKTFEWRENDRNFELNDLLVLKEFDPLLEQFTGRELTVQVTYALFGPAFHVPEGYCVLAIQKVRS